MHVFSYVFMFLFIHGRSLWAFCEPTYHLQVRRLAEGKFEFNF